MTGTYNVVIKTGKSILKGFSELFENIIDFIIAIIVLIPISFILYKILFYYNNFYILLSIVAGLIFILYLLICFFNNIIYIIVYFFSPGIKISLNSNVLKPGDTLNVRWEVKGITHIIQKLSIYLEEYESTLITDSEGSSFVDKKIKTISIFEGTGKSEIASGEASLILPEGITPSHIGPDKKTYWFLSVYPKKSWIFNIFYLSKYFGRDFGVYKYTINISGKTSDIHPVKPLYNAISSKIIVAIFASLLMICSIFVYKEMPDRYGIITGSATGIISIMLWISFVFLHNCLGCKKTSLLSNTIEGGKYCSPECYFLTPTLDDDEYEKTLGKCSLCGANMEEKNILCGNCKKKNLIEIEKTRTMTLKEKKFIELTVSKMMIKSLYNMAYLIIIIAVIYIFIHTTGINAMERTSGEIAQNFLVLCNEMSELKLQDKFLYYFTKPEELIKPMETLVNDFWITLNFMDLETDCIKIKMASIIMFIVIFFLQGMKYVFLILKPATNIIKLWNDSMGGELNYIIAPMRKEKNGEINYFRNEGKKWVVSDELFSKYEGGKPCLFEYTKNSNFLIRINGEKITPLIPFKNFFYSVCKTSYS